MAIRRGYLSSTGGFADGFTSGFGLMNQAYTDKRKLDQAEENMQYERERDAARDRQTQLNFDAQQAKLDRQYALDQQSLEARQESNRIAQETGQTQADAALQRAQTAAATEERLASAADAEAENAAYLQKAGSAIQTLNTMLQAPAGTYSYEQILEQVQATEGGVLDIYKFLDPKFQSDFANLTKTLESDLANGNVDFTNRALLDGLSSLFDARRGRLVGKTVDETFINAPDQYKTGDWEVADRFITDVKPLEGQEGMLSATVGVRLVHKETGESAYYDAPLTEGRGQGAGPAGVSIKDAIDGVAGTSMLIQEIEKHRGLVENALITSKFGGGADATANFERAVANEINSMKEQIKGLEDGKDIIPTKRNGSLTEDDFRSVARSRVLGTGRQAPDFASDRMRIISEFKEEYEPLLRRAISNDTGERIRFSDSEILRMVAQEDRAGLNNYLEKLLKSKGGRLSGSNNRTKGRGIAGSAMERNSGD